jgi:hypothetical protein
LIEPKIKPVIEELKKTPKTLKIPFNSEQADKIYQNSKKFLSLDADEKNETLSELKDILSFLKSQKSKIASYVKTGKKIDGLTISISDLIEKANLIINVSTPSKTNDIIFISNLTHIYKQVTNPRLKII